ncbi:hypothetical protein AB1L30_00335 [Bremerella sp. JC817]
MRERPIGDLIKALQQLGADIQTESAEHNASAYSRTSFVASASKSGG